MQLIDKNELVDTWQSVFANDSKSKKWCFHGWNDVCSFSTTSPFQHRTNWNPPSFIVGTQSVNGHGKRILDTSTALCGIPKMFRWLTDQYPSINRQLREGLRDVKNVDNFYLDMNGIIHPCTHGNSDDLVMIVFIYLKVLCL